jgi:hypothetical protein
MAIDRYQRWVGIASVIAIIFCVVIAMQAYHGNQLSEVVTRVYFSDDDGKTYFADAIEKGLDFSHNGKPAYRAYVYRCDSGKPFVGYLGRHAPSRAATAAAPDPRYGGKESAAPGEVEIKKPGDDKWVPLNGPKGQEIVRTLCASETPDSVLP